MHNSQFIIEHCALRIVNWRDDIMDELVSRLNQLDAKIRHIQERL